MVTKRVYNAPYAYKSMWTVFLESNIYPARAGVRELRMIPYPLDLSVSFPKRITDEGVGSRERSGKNTPINSDRVSANT